MDGNNLFIVRDENKFMDYLFEAGHVAVYNTKCHHIKIDLGAGDNHPNISFGFG